MNIYIVDAFTDVPFSGNPAAVCLLDHHQPDAWMQKVAREMNLSETAFIIKNEQGYNLRWFTPQSEVELCGHATLATAHVLWSEGFVSTKQIHFDTKSGVLTVDRDDTQLHMNFPLEIAEQCIAPMELSESLGVPIQNIAKNRFDYLVEVEGEAVVRDLAPDFTLIKKIPARGIIVTSRTENTTYDFVSRCFYPALGVDEDPVTGSAHCALGPYWANRLNKQHLKALQLSQRQGYLELKVEESRIIISGQAVTTVKGKLIV